METGKNFKKWVAMLSAWMILGMVVQPINTAAKDHTIVPASDNEPNLFLRQAEVRTDRPFQAHIMLTGSSRHSERSTNPGAAIHLGYQFSDLMQLGLTSQFFYNDNSIFDRHNDKSYDDERVFGQDGADKTTLRTDPKHLLEMKFFPWRFGMYFSAGLMHAGYEKTVTEFKSRPRIINESAYTTGLTTTLEYEAWSGAAAGVGFNFLFPNGFSLVSGLNIGLGVQTPEVTIKSDVAISATDLAEWKAQIEDNEKRIPIMYHIGVGYAF